VTTLPEVVSTTGIRGLVAAGDSGAAAQAAGRLIAATFGLPVASVELTVDAYSLNSVSGRVHFADGHTEFFKFHAEEGEERTVAEYYRARLLAEAGLPVDVPLRVSTEPGRQMALYRLRTEPRLADVCVELERAGGAAAQLSPELAAARRSLDAAIASVMLATLRPPTVSSAAAAIHQLFHHRLTGGRRVEVRPIEQGRRVEVRPIEQGTGVFPGGRYQDWYLSDPMFPELADRRFRLNGVRYALTVRQLAERAAELLDPSALAALPVVTAHGDDHQGNVWVMPGRGVEVRPMKPGRGVEVRPVKQGPELRLFDPAFASDDIPALLAPVKATYHNVFAHPFWLYHPGEAAGVTVHDDGEIVSVDYGGPMTVLRHQILDSVAELAWAPLLAALAARGQLPGNWREIVRAALFCCPLLVTNLLSAARPAEVRLLGLAQAVAAGSEPDDGTDPLARMLDAVTPA
jgi:hypothetical protein